MAVGFGIWLLWPAQAFARAIVRFIHAVPGVGTATITVDQDRSTSTVGSVGFAHATPWRSLRAGSFHWSVVEGGKTLAQGNASVGNAAYDIVLLSKGAGVTVGVYRTQSAPSGASLIRVIHAAPELGAPELKLDSKVVVHSLSYTHATAYLSVAPGVHSLSAMKVGDPAPLVSLKNLKLLPGVAYSAVVVGSRGQRVRVVTVTDRGAPLTRPAHRRTRSSHASDPSGSDPGGSVTVVAGDSLWSIARRQLGADANSAAVEREVVAIWDLNAQRIGTGDPNLIFPGQRLTLPR